MRALFVLAALAFAGCGDNIKATPNDGGGDAPIADAPIDSPPQVVGSCIDRPTDLPRPPTGALPCELLPPGFVAEVP